MICVSGTTIDILIVCRSINLQLLNGMVFLKYGIGYDWL